MSEGEENFDNLDLKEYTRERILGGKIQEFNERLQLQGKKSLKPQLKSAAKKMVRKKNKISRLGKKFKRAETRVIAKAEKKFGKFGKKKLKIPKMKLATRRVNFEPVKFIKD